MNLPTLKTKIAAGEIDTVITVFPDVFGRLVGKRFTGKFFRGPGRWTWHARVQLSADRQPGDGSMDGFQLANWDKGFGDFHLAPDLATLAGVPWQPGTALVLCDLRHETGAPVAEAPRSGAARQLEAVAARKWVCYCASELEFFLFNQAYHDLFVTDYRNLVPSSDYRIEVDLVWPRPTRPCCSPRHPRGGSCRCARAQGWVHRGVAACVIIDPVITRRDQVPVVGHKQIVVG